MALKNLQQYGCQTGNELNLKRSGRTVIFLPVYKISSFKITPPKTPNSGQFSYPLPNIVSFFFFLNRLNYSSSGAFQVAPASYYQTFKINTGSC
jgi:hypothetical protein